jgi:hypothetical protein
MFLIASLIKVITIIFLSFLAAELLIWLIRGGRWLSVKIRKVRKYFQNKNQH